MPHGAGDEPELPPGGGRGRPALPGRTAQDKKRPGEHRTAGGPGGPGDQLPMNPSRFGTPRNLQGTRDNRPRWRPGSPQSEEIPMRTLPTLNGRLGPAAAQLEETVETAEQAMRPGLSGRGLGRPAEREQPLQPKRRPRAEPERQAPTVDFVGDSELFAAEEAAPAVIARPEETKPVARGGDAALRPATPADPGAA
jgi:hypothetical protein